MEVRIKLLQCTLCYDTASATTFYSTPAWRLERHLAVHRIDFHTYLFYNPVCGQAATGDGSPTTVEDIDVTVSVLGIHGDTQVSQVSAREHTFYPRRAYRTAVHRCLLFSFHLGLLRRAQSMCTNLPLCQCTDNTACAISLIPRLFGDHNGILS